MSSQERKMRVSFDLDEVLFVSPKTHKTEPALPFPLRNLFPERLRLGTPELIWELQIQGYEVWIYTSSFRSESYIRRLFRCILCCRGFRFLSSLRFRGFRRSDETGRRRSQCEKAGRKEKQTGKQDTQSCLHESISLP